jgi:hypothetical protein
MHISDFDSEKKTVSFDVIDPDMAQGETRYETYHYEDEKLEPYFEKAMLSSELLLDIVYEPSEPSGVRASLLSDVGKIIRAYLKDRSGNTRPI